MSLFNIFQIAGSGMSAQSVRLNLTASNLANADSVAPSSEQAYKARHPVFAATMQGVLANSSSGVQTLGVVESQADHMARYAPNDPLADERGYVYQSNVDVVEEMANMISASRSYQNNADMLNTSKELTLRTLRLGESG